MQGKTRQVKARHCKGNEAQMQGRAKARQKQGRTKAKQGKGKAGKKQGKGKIWQREWQGRTKAGQRQGREKASQGSVRAITPSGLKSSLRDSFLASWAEFLPLQVSLLHYGPNVTPLQGLFLLKLHKLSVDCARPSGAHFATTGSLM